MADEPISTSRRKLLQLGTVLSMNSLIPGCSVDLPPRSGASNAPRLKLIALGGPMLDQARAERGASALAGMGFALENRACLTRRVSRFAGTDEERLADLNDLADTRTDMPDLIMATRGGFGTARLLERIDYARLCPRLKETGAILMGYSDNTAAQLALLAKGGVVTFSGPMMYGDFGATPPSDFMLGWLRRVLSEPAFDLRVDTPQTDRCDVSGMLWGGNLSMLISLTGTPWMPAVEGGILFLEDVGEDVYRVERMLLQLLQAGILERQSAIVLGQFTAYKPDGFDAEGYTLRRMLDTFRTRLSVPILTGLPVGHVPDIVPMPIGAQARLIAGDAGFTLHVSGYPVLKRFPAAFTRMAGGDINTKKD